MNLNNNDFFAELKLNACETGTIIEEVKWSIDKEPKPKAKVRIPILMPMESASGAKTETKSINSEGGKSISGTSSTYTTSNYITLDIPIELDIGKGIGQFKVEHENEYVKKKGSAIQWENKLIYRGITSSRLKDDFDLLTDELTYTKPTKYKFNSEELRIDENN